MDNLDKTDSFDSSNFGLIGRQLRQTDSARINILQPIIYDSSLVHDKFKVNVRPLVTEQSFVEGIQKGSVQIYAGSFDSNDNYLIN